MDKNILLISNNVDSIGVEYPKEAVIRINTAWVNTVDTLRTELNRLKNYSIYLDYPIGRKKPPLPKMTEAQLLTIVEQYKNIKYFAWSNAENSEALSNFRFKLSYNFNRKDVMLVPKIETLLGVLHLEEIIKASKTQLIMIDKEDLATDAGDPEVYQHFLEHARKKAKELNIFSIELKGVIFN